MASPDSHADESKLKIIHIVLHRAFLCTLEYNFIAWKIMAWKRQYLCGALKNVLELNSNASQNIWQNIRKNFGFEKNIYTGSDYILIFVKRILLGEGHIV